MQLTLDPNSIESYRTFLRVKQLPIYRIRGRVAEFPDEYAASIGLKVNKPRKVVYQPWDHLFDYQRAIADLAIRKRKFAVFADPGLGKTFILAEVARHALNVLPKGKRVLWVSPLMVCSQTIAEIRRFYGDSLPVEQVAAAEFRLTWWSGNQYVYMPHVDGGTELYFVQVICRGRTK